MHSGLIYEYTIHHCGASLSEYSRPFLGLAVLVVLAIGEVIQDEYAC